MTFEQSCPGCEHMFDSLGLSSFAQALPQTCVPVGILVGTAFSLVKRQYRTVGNKGRPTQADTVTERSIEGASTTTMNEGLR